MWGEFRYMNLPTGSIGDEGRVGNVQGRGMEKEGARARVYMSHTAKLDSMRKRKERDSESTCRANANGRSDMG